MMSDEALPTRIFQEHEAQLRKAAEEKAMQLEKERRQSSEVEQVHDPPSAQPQPLMQLCLS